VLGEITLIVPVPFELARNARNEVICGPGTKLACDQAITFARAIQNTRVFFSATQASAKYDRVVMGRVMEGYVNKHAPNVPTDFHESPLFSTIGDLIALAEFINKWKRSRPKLGLVLFTTKDWHAKRIEQVAKAVFRWKGCDMAIQLKTHPFTASRKLRMMEPIKIRRDLFLVWLLKNGLLEFRPKNKP
jgi:hypothetical protein